TRCVLGPARALQRAAPTGQAPCLRSVCRNHRRMPMRMKWLAVLCMAIGPIVLLQAQSASARSLYSQQNVVAHTSEFYWISPNQHVNVFWSDGSYHWADLTLATGADPAAADSALSGVSLNGKAQTSEVYFITNNQHVAQFWYGNGGWHWSDFSTSIGAP